MTHDEMQLLLDQAGREASWAARHGLIDEDELDDYTAHRFESLLKHKLELEDWKAWRDANIPGGE